MLTGRSAPTSYHSLLVPTAVPPCFSPPSRAPPPHVQAAAAIQALNGATLNGSQLVVKLADADVQPRVESGRQPSEWW